MTATTTAQQTTATKMRKFPLSGLLALALMSFVAVRDGGGLLSSPPAAPMTMAAQQQQQQKIKVSVVQPPQSQQNPNPTAHRAHLEYPNTNTNVSGRQPEQPQSQQQQQPPPFQFKSSARRCPPRSVGELKSAGMMKSQRGEDGQLLSWFNGLCGGTYVEMGALDGIRYSNSHVFSRAFGWRGLLVEMNPSHYSRLVRTRPNELALVNAAACSDSRVVHWYGHGATGGVYEFAAPSFRKRWWKDVDLSKAKKIDCMPLRDIIQNHVADKLATGNDNSSSTSSGTGGGVYFDFFSLDVEGAEVEVLRGVDFDAVAFGVVLVEADEHNPMKNEALRSFVESKGYRFAMEKGWSYWFVNRNFHSVYEHLLYDDDSSVNEADEDGEEGKVPKQQKATAMKKKKKKKSQQRR